MDSRWGLLEASLKVLLLAIPKASCSAALKGMQRDAAKDLQKEKQTADEKGAIRVAQKVA